MSAWELTACLLCVGLLAYLFAVLLKPEDYS